MLIQKKLDEDGRGQVWLKEELKKRGYVISRASMCNIARANSLPRDLKVLKEICDILSLDFEECLMEYAKKRDEETKTEKEASVNAEQTGEQPIQPNT